MKKFGMILFISLVALQAEAVLPPLYQTSSEIKAIMVDEQLGEKLQSGEVIEKIEKTDQGYTITTNKSSLAVKVLLNNLLGPNPVVIIPFNFSE
jgi:hypothetical protein